MQHDRGRRVDDPPAGSPHAQRDVGLLAKAGAGVEVADAAEFAHHAHANRHVGAEHVVDVDVAARVGCEEPGQATVGQQQADLADALLLLARLLVARSTAHRRDRRVVVRLHESFEPVGIGERVVVDERHHVLSHALDADRARGRGRADAALVAPVLDLRPIGDDLPGALVGRRVDDDDPLGPERLRVEVLEAGPHVVGTVVGGDHDRDGGCAHVVLSFGCASNSAR
nr:hypothetical protein [Agromyces mangrovi]